jgi:hypothetical protein
MLEGSLLLLIIANIPYYESLKENINEIDINIQLLVLL